MEDTVDKEEFCTDESMKVTQETIGMRTRSKFPLNDTPLEIIEQAFIPPDITEDMYDSACENDEWMKFLSEFTKPLDSVQNDDGEDDPEYNILCDNDFSKVDKEEFYIDESVKVTQETIGMRTRSKFPLNDTPLEIIEQAFIPPDITEDMYNSTCENDEWMEFICEFTKPLDSVQNDDGEDDPEYNIFCDNDFSKVDKEEFYIDESVKVTQETIGMRTRSKFPLNDTPLEIIEQAFIPPDITENMLDSNYENDEWLEFINEFTKPLDSVQNDDGEDDPEYNVFCDDDFTKVDKEEFCIDKSVKATQETIGMRTRSKFPLNDTPLEIIEQAFIPPDITENMLDSTYENDEWMEFISEFTKPTESVQNYDDDLDSSTACFLNNKNAVKLTNCSPSKPVLILNYSNWKPNTTCSTNGIELMEVARCNTQMDKQLNISEFNNNPLRINEQHNNNANEDISIIENSVPQHVKNSSHVNIMTQKQIILLKQQLTQHVQLITQNYLLSTMSKKFQNHCKKLQNMLERTKDFCKNKKYAPINIHSSLKFIRDWTEVKTMEMDINNDHVILPLDVKKFMLYYDKPVFIYPQLLPTRTYHNELIYHPIGPSEEKLLVLKIDYIYKKLKWSINTRAKYKKKNLSDLMPIIIKTVHQRWFTNRNLKFLKQFITRRKNAYETNVIKNYFTHGKIEDLSYVIDVDTLCVGKRLFECDVRKFPSSWQSIRNQIKSKN